MTAHPGGRYDFDSETFVATAVTGNITHALNTANNGKGYLVTYPILEPGARTGVSTTDVRAGMGIGDQDDPMFTLQAGKQHGVAIALQDVTSRSKGQNGKGWNDAGVSFTLDATATQGVATGMAVRRLLPTECMKLQSFPPDYFDNVVYRGKPLADGQMYKMIGNSWNTDTVRWIFRRIDAEWRKPVADTLKR